MILLELDPKWIDNLKTFFSIFSSITALVFAAIGGVARVLDERAQVPDKIQREKDLSRLRKFYRVLSRVVSYGNWDAAIDNAVLATRKLLTHALLRPDPRFDPCSAPIDTPWVGLVPTTVFLAWSLYRLYDIILDEIDDTLNGFNYGLGGLITGSFQITKAMLLPSADGSWSSHIIDFIVLPIFLFTFMIFSVLWGRLVIVFLQALIRKLPDPIWRVYRPYSQVPKLILYSFSITLAAIVLGKFVSPESPAPGSPPILLLNMMGDALSILLAGFAFRSIQHRRRFFSRTGRLAKTFAILSILTVALSAISVTVLWGSLYGTSRAIPFEGAMHILVAKPYHDHTISDTLISLANETAIKDKAGANQVLVLLVMAASQTGNIKLIDDWVSKYDSADLDNHARDLKQLASEMYHATDGIGPYFWIMHTTFLPILFLSFMVLLHSFSLLLRKPVALVLAASGRVERPYNMIFVTCAAISAFFVLANRLVT
jgi:hypothetical protein